MQQYPTACMSHTDNTPSGPYTGGAGGGCDGGGGWGAVKKDNSADQVFI